MGRKRWDRSPDTPDWLWERHPHTTAPQDWTVVEELAGYAIVCWAGGSYWNGHMNNYHPSEYQLMQVSSDDHAYSETIHEGGRLTNELKAQLHKVLVEDRVKCAAKVWSATYMQHYRCENKGKIRERPDQHDFAGRHKGVRYIDGFEDVPRWVCGTHSAERILARREAEKVKEQEQRDRGHQRYLEQTKRERDLVEATANMLGVLEGQDPYQHGCQRCGECAERALVDLKVAHEAESSRMEEADAYRERIRTGAYW